MRLTARMTTVPAAPSSPAHRHLEVNAPLPLSQAPVGWRRVITGVDGPDQPELEGHGLVPGGVVVVAARTPLGGPLVVELEGSRVRLTAPLAAQVATRPYTAADERAS